MNTCFSKLRMIRPMWMLLLLTASTVTAQRLNVRVLDRQDKEDAYDYAGTYNLGNGNKVASAKTFKVHGATLTLGLPDGRQVVVNCESKFAEHMAGHAGNRRSCRVPLVDNIDAEFKGDNAKLSWAVSLDGKKLQSETYKVLAVLDKPNSN